MKLFCDKCNSLKVRDQYVIEKPKDAISMSEFAMNGGGLLSPKKVNNSQKHLLKCLDCGYEIYYIANY